MKKLSLLFIACLTACGGGSSTPNTTTTPTVSELEGTWVYSTGSHTTGTACGLDIHGAYETRTTFTFSGNAITGKKEVCAILTGNTGGFIQNDSLTGIFKTGDIYLTSGTESYKTLDITSNGTTQYTGYALLGTKFKLPLPNPATGADGSTPAKRINTAASVYTPGAGLVDQPVFVKQ
ncbi:hypothetical protein [Undibacterium umbellatum]|uniref:Lipocalin-like domain-containing protein n=1 Tax=Undibacterium umbellatum TaxID=2762300 RepID=A0ABR6ZAN4_9BURK|nr:hypothetical protein [Undibacterium umbellatum]MBC3908252.1 hypothetical protein [Undibacterium umbellatum]